MVWIVIAVMTGAAVLCVVWPLSKPRRDAGLSPGSDLRFYREQLHALDREVTSGTVETAEAAGSRAEIGRRLIAAADRSALPPARLRRPHLLLTAAVIIVAVPAISLALYRHVGQPETADMPLASRAAGGGVDDVGIAVARVESHLVGHPDDGRGWEILAPLYMRFGRYGDAVHAYDRAITLQGDTAARQTGYGQALMLQAGGVVTADARAAFDKALADDSTAPQPQFFLGIAAEQDGDKQRARAIWSALLAKTPAEAPWRSLVADKLAALDGVAPPVPASSGPLASPQAAAVAGLPADARLKAIHGMVDGLAARLAQNGQDRDGWLKLVRAYAVLGEKDKALDALSTARRTLAADSQGIAQLDGLARELGLDS